MKSTLQEVIGLQGDAWLRIDSCSGKIELNSDEQWQETGWRFNAITGELEVILGSVYERSGYGYCEKAGVVTSLQDLPVTRTPSCDFQPLRHWLSTNHNWALLCGLLLVASSFLGFYNHTGNSFPAAPVAMCILAALFATWLAWHRSSMKAALLFILTMTSSRVTWLYPLLHRETFGTASDPSLQVHSNATIPSDRSGLSQKLYQYVKDQDVVGVEEIIGQGADSNFPNPDGSGKSPLHLAAASGNVAIVRILLDRAASINAQDAEGDTALHAAVEADSFEVLGMLLDHGAATDLRSKKGQCAMDRTLKTIGKPMRDRIDELLCATMLKRGEMIQVPNDLPTVKVTAPKQGSFSTPLDKIRSGVLLPEVSQEAKSISSLATEIEVIEDHDGMLVWMLHGKVIYISPNQFARDALGGEPSPDGNYIHFGSQKITTDSRTPRVFRKEAESLTYMGDVTHRVVSAINESKIIPGGRKLSDRCFVDVVRWLEPAKLLLIAYGNQQGEDGFTVSKFPCLWDIEAGRFSYAPDESNVKAEVNLLENSKPQRDSSPDPSTFTGGPMAQGESSGNSITAFLDVYYKTFVNGTPEKWAGMFTNNPFYSYANARVPRAKLIAESRELQARWPSRLITPHAHTFQLYNNGNNGVLSTSFPYTYSNASGKTTSGVSNIELGLVWVNGRWLIDSFVEVVSKTATLPSGIKTHPSPSANHYTGSVGNLGASFSLVWGQDGQIEGSYFYPARDPGHKYVLKGKNLVEGQLNLIEYDNGNPSANLSLAKKTRDGKVVWSGIMSNQDGRQIPVEMIRN